MKAWVLCRSHIQGCLRARSRSWDLKISRVFLSPPRRNGTKIVRDAGAVSVQRKILKSWKRHFPSCWFQHSWSGFHILTWLTWNLIRFYRMTDTLNLHFFWDSVGFNWEITPHPTWEFLILFLGLAFILFLFLFCFQQKVFFLIYSLLPFKGNQSIFTIIIPWCKLIKLIKRFCYFCLEVSEVWFLFC